MKRLNLWKATRLLRHTERLLIYSGAGLSAPSGIPTFDTRDSDFLDDWGIERWRSDPDWRAEVEQLTEQHAGAAPNAGHEAIEGLVATRGATHVTTNVDGLTPGLELCGNARRQIVDAVTGLSRPDVVFVGEMFWNKALRRYDELIWRMDGLLIVGASPLVGLWEPAVWHAREWGLPVVNVNPNPEPIWRTAADVTVRMSADRALPELARRLA